MIQQFLIFCSGADRTVLASCPGSERNKYASIGATVLFTGIMAALSSGYALYTIFKSERFALGTAFFFGLLWGLLIFNLDRYIVSSLRKTGDNNKEWLYATPRFIIAILISFVIAKPLEVRIFESRIKQQIHENKINKLVEEKQKIEGLNDLQKLNATIDKIEDERKLLESQKLESPPSDYFRGLMQSRQDAKEAFSQKSEINNRRIAELTTRISEIKGNNDNYKIDSSGNYSNILQPQYSKQVKDLVLNRNILSLELKRLQQEIAVIDSTISKERQSHRETVSKQINSNAAELDSTKKDKRNAEAISEIQFDESKKVKEESYTDNFITQVEALSDLNDELFSTMWWTSTLLVLLFLAIETAPIVVKLITKRGPYEDSIERLEHEHHVEQQRLISDKNDEINNLITELRAFNKLKVEMRVSAEKNKLEAEIKANEELLADIAKRQCELAKIAVEKWYSDELSKLNTAPAAQPVIRVV